MSTPALRFLPVALVVVLVTSCVGWGPSAGGGGAGGEAGDDGSGGSGAGGAGGDGTGGSGGSGETPREAVCRIWREGHVENEKTPWLAGVETCDPGELSEVAVEDTLRRINMYRRLSGLPPVTEDVAQRDQDQACAVLMNVKGALSHTPPTTWDCWSQKGYDGANSSNLALGYLTPGNAIDGLMADTGVPSQGHRRWLLGYFLGKVGIGFAGRATCIGVFDDSSSTDRAWTAYPPAGPAPADMVKADGNGPVAWSFHPADGIEGAEVTMQRLPGGDEITVTSWIPDPGWKIPDAIAWQPPAVRAGESYRITITRPAKDPVVYDVELVSCARTP